MIPPYNSAYSVVDLGEVNRRSVDSRYSSVNFPDVYLEIVKTLEKYGFALSVSDNQITTTNYLVGAGGYWLPQVNEPVIMWSGSLGSYCVTGCFWVQYKKYQTLYGSTDPLEGLREASLLAGDVHRDVFFFSLNTTGSDWNLPFRFNHSDDDWNLVELESYEVPKRVRALDLSLFNETLGEDSTVCDYVSKLIRYSNVNGVETRTYGGAWDSWQRVYNREYDPIFNTNLWLGFPDSYLRFVSYDYDGGGEIDIREWANFRDRFNPEDDVTSCGGNVDLPSGETSGLTTTPVDWGKETKSLYLNGLTGLVGSPPSVPELDEVELPQTEKVALPSRETLFNEIKSRSDAALATGQYAALREVFAPLASGVELPRWSLPSSTVVLGDTSATFDLSFLQFDLNELKTDSALRVVFDFLYKLIELGLILITAWYVKNLLWSSLIDSPDDGSK